MRSWISAAALGVVCSLIWAPGASAAPEPLAPQYGIGTPGGTAGQLNQPFDVAVDAAGNLHIAELQNNRISIFDAQGAFVRAFGFDVIPGNAETGFEVCTATCKAGVAGGGAGQLNQPTGVALDAAGNLHVAEFGNDRISTFNAQGAFVRAIGFDVELPAGGTGFETCTANCKAGVAGGGAGQLSDPFDVAVDAAGNVHVADRSNNRISTFNAQGAFVRAIGFDVELPAGGTGFETCTANCKAGVAGGAAGQLNAPEGVAVDAAGDLHVAGSHRISTFNAQGAFVRGFGFDVDPAGAAGFETCTANCKAGVEGGGAGQLFFPHGIASDPAGNLHVADRSNNRISTFNAQDAFVRAFGFDVIPGDVTGFEVCTASCKAGVAGNGAGQLSDPPGVATDCRGAVYVADIANHRIQRFGEPGTALPPCAGGDTPPGGTPSNEFTIGKLKRNTKKGTAKVTIEVPGAGELELAGGKVKSGSKQAAAAGEVKLMVKAKGNAKEKLADNGSVKVKLAVTFTPTGGDPNTETKKAKLKLNG